MGCFRESKLDIITGIESCLQDRKEDRKLLGLVQLHAVSLPIER